jgi:hypothetical protein
MQYTHLITRFLIALLVLVIEMVGCSTPIRVPVSSLVMPKATLADVLESWETYQNPEYGFTLKYPSTLSVSEKQGNSWVEIIFENASFHLHFFAGAESSMFPGLAESIGPARGSLPIWSKSIIIDGQETRARLARVLGTAGNEVILHIDSPRYHDKTRFDFFSSVFDATQEDVIIPQVEAIAKTLTYTK